MVVGGGVQPLAGTPPANWAASTETRHDGTVRPTEPEGCGSLKTCEQTVIIPTPMLPMRPDSRVVPFVRYQPFIQEPVP